MSKQKVIWRCQECGATQPKWTGSCNTCQSWNSFAEELFTEEKKRYIDTYLEKNSQPVSLKDISDVVYSRHTTKMDEVDRLLGGGLVPGALLLLAGDPGIGKSTLLLQLSEKLASQGHKVLYICGEESKEQTSLRAKRLKIDEKNLFLLSETLFENIEKHILALKPQFLIVDSIQILYKSSIPSAPGSVVQVREIALEFLHLSKGSGITTFLIGHVTKSGEVAGPKVLEHIVDVVLSFEGDNSQGFRLLRCSKNRFGPTDDIALFQMKEMGLAEVANPSAIFLEERRERTPGSAIVPTLEGARAILIEVQALVSSSAFSSPSRKCTGLDPNRLMLLLAVMEKRLGYKLYQFDVFVSIAGGLKMSEPGMDLGIILSIASSFTQTALDPKTVMVGEVGLSGEVRGVSRIESRLKEAFHMGFTRCLLPKRNLKEASHLFQNKIQLIGVDLVDEAIRWII